VKGDDADVFQVKQVRGKKITYVHFLQKLQESPPSPQLLRKRQELSAGKSSKKVIHVNAQPVFQFP
jgi:hypothetical protein